MPPSKSRNKLRKIASNRLLRRTGLLRNLLVRLNEQGEVVEVRTTENPDREPFTEFYAGLLVLGLDREQIEQVLKSREPLHEWLPALLTDQPTLHLVTGLDPASLCATPSVRVQRLK